MDDSDGWADVVELVEEVVSAEDETVVEELIADVDDAELLELEEEEPPETANAPENEEALDRYYVE